MQDDILFDTLTPYKTLEFVAKKRGSLKSNTQIEGAVQTLLDKLKIIEEKNFYG